MENRIPSSVQTWETFLSRKWSNVCTTLIIGVPHLSVCLNAFSLKVTDQCPPVLHQNFYQDLQLFWPHEGDFQQAAVATFLQGTWKHQKYNLAASTRMMDGLHIFRRLEISHQLLVIAWYSYKHSHVCCHFYSSFPFQVHLKITRRNISTSRLSSTQMTAGCLTQHLVAFTSTAGAVAWASTSICGGLTDTDVKSKMKTNVQVTSKLLQNTIRQGAASDAALFPCQQPCVFTVNGGFKPVTVEVWERVSGQGREEAGLFLQIQACFCNLIFHCLHIWSCM